MILKNQSGFTLVELMMSIAISGIIGASLFNFFNFNRKTLNIQNQKIEMQQNARLALEYISKIIINAGYDPLNIGFDPLGKSSNDSYLKIFTDSNRDGEILDDDFNEATAFLFDSKKQIIYRMAKKQKKALIENITNLQFKYDIPPPHTNSISISITARTNEKVNGKYNTYTLESDVLLRNRS